MLPAPFSFFREPLLSKTFVQKRAKPAFFEAGFAAFA